MCTYSIYTRRLPAASARARAAGSTEGPPAGTGLGHRLQAAAASLRRVTALRHRAASPAASARPEGREAVLDVGPKGEDRGAQRLHLAQR